jgi:hypothetical protein
VVLSKIILGALNRDEFPLPPGEGQGEGINGIEAVKYPLTPTLSLRERE